MTTFQDGSFPHSFHMWEDCGSIKDNLRSSEKQVFSWLFLDWAVMEENWHFTH